MTEAIHVFCSTTLFKGRQNLNTIRSGQADLGRRRSPAEIDGSFTRCPTCGASGQRTLTLARNFSQELVMVSSTEREGACSTGTAQMNSVPGSARVNNVEKI